MQFTGLNLPGVYSSIDYLGLVEGYKSALGQARDEAKAAEAKKKGGKVAALENADDTASDDDGHGVVAVDHAHRILPRRHNRGKVPKGEGYHLWQSHRPVVAVAHLVVLHDDECLHTG